VDNSVRKRRRRALTLSQSYRFLVIAQKIGSLCNALVFLTKTKIKGKQTITFCCAREIGDNDRREVERCVQLPMAGHGFMIKAGHGFMIKKSKETKEFRVP
jgi:hypothetical protein